MSNPTINLNSQNDISESRFDGGLLELVVYTIATYLISVFTLGIGYPWAMCLLYSWEINHTVINGKRLYFDGKGSQLFGNYIKWLLLTLITFGIYGFWLGIKVKQWKTKHTHFY